jgi:hypothetical protein
MIRKVMLLVDNLVNRDKYLSGLKKRIDYFKDRQSSTSKRVIDDSADTTVGDDFFVPEIEASALNIDFLKQSIRQSGCVIVRNFFDADDVEEMKSYVDHSFSLNSNNGSFINKYLTKQIDLAEVLDKTKEDIKSKRKDNPTYTDTVKIGRKLTQPLGMNKSFLTVQTPILTEKLLNLFANKQLKKLLTEYFENEPCVSVYKWVLRKAGPPENPIDFHQDGTFMGDEIASLNCWIPLSDCGDGYDVHGIDIVPIRFNQSFGKGTGVLDWTISPKAIVDQYSEAAIVTPTFRKGDAFFFDHLLIHRTQCMPNFAEKRYAIETWFFDSVNFPKNQIPMKW